MIVGPKIPSMDCYYRYCWLTLCNIDQLGVDPHQSVINNISPDRTLLHLGNKTANIEIYIQ